MHETLLSVTDCTTGYGPTSIVFNASIEVGRNEVVSIVGPNGAGKSTLLKAIAGVLRCSRGTIEVGGQEMTNLCPAEIALRGVAYVPQEANVFRQMTVRENLAMGAWVRKDALGQGTEQVLTLFPDLERHMNTRAGNLSGGQRQMLAFGMALMVSPSVLLLDEPSAGLSPKLVSKMFETVRRVNEAGVAVLMIEQNAIQALAFSHRGVVMAAGRVVMSGPAQELLDSRDVSELYLGTRQ